MTAFAFRSGSAPLDFAATLMFREGAPAPRELLVAPQDFGRWLAASGILDGAPAVTGDDLTAAVRLREAIYRLCTARLAGRPLIRADLRTLNQHAATPPPAPRLGARGRLQTDGTAAAGLSALARGTIALLAGPDADRLRQCGRDGCTRLFLDRSRGQNRTWCGMRECGNRVNAAAYRRRRAAVTS